MPRHEPASASWRGSAAGSAIADCTGCCAGKDVGGAVRFAKCAAMRLAPARLRQPAEASQLRFSEANDGCRDVCQHAHRESACYDGRPDRPTETYCLAKLPWRLSNCLPGLASRRRTERVGDETSFAYRIKFGSASDPRRRCGRTLCKNMGRARLAHTQKTPELAGGLSKNEAVACIFSR